MGVGVVGQFWGASQHSDSPLHPNDALMHRLGAPPRRTFHTFLISGGHQYINLLFIKEKIELAQLLIVG